MHSTKHEEYLAPVIAITQQAGALLMRYFQQEFTVASKADDSPVTEADIAANRMIGDALKQLDPGLPVVAEEDEVLAESAEYFWLVDPLDGTRAFVAGEGEFTVNIGLIRRGVPVLGVVGVPAQGLLYYGEQGRGAFKVVGDAAPAKIQVRRPPAEGLTVVRSKSHPSAKTQAFLDTLQVRELIEGSSSVKFCQVAEGRADLYPRFGRTMEWDTAAGHAILNAAGGRVVDAVSGQLLRYGKPHFENPHFIAYGYDT